MWEMIFTEGAVHSPYNCRIVSATEGIINGPRGPLGSFLDAPGLISI